MASRNQMAELFDRDVKTIGKHINNALKEELDTYIHYTDFYIAENRTAHWSGWLQISFHSACTVSV